LHEKNSSMAIWMRNRRQHIARLSRSHIFQHLWRHPLALEVQYDRTTCLRIRARVTSCWLFARLIVVRLRQLAAKVQRDPQNPDKITVEAQGPIYAKRPYLELVLVSQFISKIAARPGKRGAGRRIVDIISLFNSRNTKIAHPNTAKSFQLPTTTSTIYETGIFK
jgi:hypothetical protein